VEWEVPPLLVPPVVLLLKSEEWAVPPQLLSPVVVQVAQRVLLVEKKLPTFQKKHDGCYWWRRNYILFRNNMTGATSGGETAHSSEVTRRLLLVEEELPTLHK
jgi:hypothetical protein